MIVIKEEKNKMNKKLMVFSIMALFAVTLVTAGLVNYLSNTQEVDLYVDSPMAVSEITGADLSGYKGGETATIEFDITNNANVDIDAKIQMIMTADDISVNDFNSIMTEITDGGWSSGVMNALDVGGMIESVEVIEDNLIITTISVPWATIDGPWTVVSEISFASAVVGDYNIEVTMIPL